MAEKIIEKGIVIKAEEGIAEVALLAESNCEECHAKLLCNPSHQGDTKTLQARDPVGVHPGEEVRFSVMGRTIFKASLLLYGIPLVLLVGGILLGMEIFAGSSQPEALSFLAGTGLAGLYYSALYTFGKLKKSMSQFAPEILEVTKSMADLREVKTYHFDE